MTSWAKDNADSADSGLATDALWPVLNWYVGNPRAVLSGKLDRHCLVLEAEDRDQARHFDLVGRKSLASPQCQKAQVCCTEEAHYNLPADIAGHSYCIVDSLAVQ